MSYLFWYGLSWPFIIVAIVMRFAVWHIFSTGEWKVKKPELRLDLLHQDQITSLHRQMREMTRSHQSEMDELRQRHNKELQRLNRRY